MVKKNYQSINLSCVMQNSELTSESTSNGVLSINPSDGSFRFEEAIRKGRAPRNPKLFDGNYISMVRMQNGKYQMHLKTMSADFDREKFAFGVYSEITAALQIID